MEELTEDICPTAEHYSGFIKNVTKYVVKKDDTVELWITSS